MGCFADSSEKKRCHPMAPPNPESGSITSFLNEARSSFPPPALDILAIFIDLLKQDLNSSMKSWLDKSDLNGS